MIAGFASGNISIGGGFQIVPGLLFGGFVGIILAMRNPVVSYNIGYYVCFPLSLSG